MFLLLIEIFLRIAIKEIVKSSKKVIEHAKTNDELTILRSLSNNNDNLLKYYDDFEIEVTLYILTEYCEVIFKFLFYFKKQTNKIFTVLYYQIYSLF